MGAMLIDIDNPHARLRRIMQLIEAKEYAAVGGSRRYLAGQRRLTWRASRTALLVVAASAPGTAFVLSLLHPGHLGFLALVTGMMGGFALAAWWALGHGLRRRPELVLFAAALVVLFGMIALGLGGPKLVDLSFTYLIALPMMVALLIPWRTSTEIRWLAVNSVIGTAFVALVPASALSAGDRGDLVVALSTSLIGSFVGHKLLFRNHVTMFSQLQSIAHLHRSQNSQRVELERVYRSLEITARTDELTRVGNRMKLQEDLVTVRARVGRTARPIGILEIDLDHFKGVNDVLGHLAGDAVLRQVGSALRTAVRTEDLVFRYGGEEFLVILDSIAGGVEAAGERIRLAVENLGLAHPGNPPFGLVTISVGAAAFGPGDLAQNADEWFARVDAAMYAAKAAGRNQVAVADGSIAMPAPRPRPGVGHPIGSIIVAPASR
ncbi:MAG TPA: GGDEF domain-containing protein [Candidatus Limnocylindrales bacterium]|nr:GGDEF domain-containing protein [Candidatus Limnocylindrales bacterium]